MTIRQALGNAKQKDKEMDQNRAKSFVRGDRAIQLGISKILMVNFLPDVLNLIF